MEYNAENSYDIWTRSFEEEKFRKYGFYESIGHIRWRSLIDKATSISGPVRVLKTDGWNEAKGTDSSLIDSIQDDNVVIGDVSCEILNSISRPIKKVQLDIRSLPFRYGTFGLILDISTSDHCGFDEFSIIISEYSRILKDNGMLLIIHNSSYSLPWKMMRFFGVFSPAYSSGPPAHYFSPNKVRDVLLEKNFQIQDTRYTNFMGWAKNLINWQPIRNRWLAMLFAELELKISLPLAKFFGRQHVIIAKKKERGTTDRRYSPR